VHSEDDDLEVGDARRGDERQSKNLQQGGEKEICGFGLRLSFLGRCLCLVINHHRPAIALLICGGLTGIARERNGDYLDIHHTFLKDTSHTDFTLDPYFVARDPSVFPDEDQYDCIMLTGSDSP